MGPAPLCARCAPASLGTRPGSARGRGPHGPSPPGALLPSPLQASPGLSEPLRQHLPALPADPTHPPTRLPGASPSRAPPGHPTGSWSPELASGPWRARTRLPPSTPLTLTPGPRPGWAAPPRAGSPRSWLDSGPWLGSLPAPGSPGAAPHLSPRTAPLGRLCPECLTQDPGLRLVGRDGVFKLGLQGLQLCGHGADGGLGAQQAAWGQGAAPGGGSRPSAQAPAGSCVPSWASWMVHPGRRGRPAAPADQVLGPEGSQR